LEEILNEPEYLEIIHSNNISRIKGVLWAI
jgi:hypothetical protein